MRSCQHLEFMKICQASMKTAANMNNKRSWTKQQDHFTRPWYKHPTIVTLTNSDFFDPGVGPWAEPSRSSWGARSLATFLFFWRPRFYRFRTHHRRARATHSIKRTAFETYDSWHLFWMSLRHAQPPPLPSERSFPSLKCSQMMRGLQTLAAACDRLLCSAQEEAARMIFLGVHDGSWQQNKKTGS